MTTTLIMAMILSSFLFASLPVSTTSFTPSLSSSGSFHQHQNQNQHQHRACLLSSSLSLSSSSSPSSPSSPTTKTTTTTMSSTNDENNSKTIIIPDAVIATKSSILDKDLTSDERSVVNTVRRRAPSVAYVTSYSIPPTSSQGSSAFRRRRQDKSGDKNNSKDKETIPPARSTPLGSGSAFAISSSDGYFMTNYHVIERAYEMQQSQTQMDGLYRNITQSLFGSTSASSRPSSRRRIAQVYLRLSSSGSSTTSTSASASTLIPARIVSVKPELDSAILHINPKDISLQSTSGSVQDLPDPIPYGSSSKLLVGQSVLAIGNPFGLDQSITSGVVSALDRSVKGIANNQIRNCIQTDAAINPGNSGGPLLDSNGDCIGMNTMIISTSGSNAGIGFAISIDDIRDYAENEIEKDRMEQLILGDSDRIASGSGNGDTNGGKRKRGSLGIEILLDKMLQSQLMKRVEQQKKSASTSSASTDDTSGVFITKVNKNSPADKAQMKPSTIDKSTSRIAIGDRIIAINSNMISSQEQLYNDLKTRVVGEKLSITLEDGIGERRIVYVEIE
jgi:S1-C subfamily serine protease